MNLVQFFAIIGVVAVLLALVVTLFKWLGWWR